MEPSPLTQQTRPELFQPKVVELYQALFKEGKDEEKSEGFWQELFLLRPNTTELHRLLTGLRADDVLQLQAQTQSLFTQAVSAIRRGTAPQDENALDTLTVFLVVVLPKRFSDPNSDIINVLAGLDRVDAIFTEFVHSLDMIIRHGRTLDLRQKAVDTSLAIASSAFRTSLLTYFTHRDLFPSITKYIQDVEDDLRIAEPLLLLGLLANYNKFEFQNPYRLRLDDFVNESVIRKTIEAVGSTSSSARDKYIEVQDDLPEEWSLTSTLTYLGLGNLSSNKRLATRAADPETAKVVFARLPPHDAAILLSIYDFANANKLFCLNLVNMAARDMQHQAPFSTYLSFTSYLITHAHRCSRTGLYAYLNLLVLRILMEDQVLCKHICSEKSKMFVRLCRQRQPYLPLVKGERVLVTVFLDIMVDGINRNLRRKLDVDLYLLCVRILLRIVSVLGRSRIRLAYHWSDLWRSLLSLIRFLTTYATDLKALPSILILVDALIKLIVLSLSTGETFLPNTVDYDDLFYKIIESGEVLSKFSDVYALSKRPSNSIKTLLSVSEHYTNILLQEESSSSSTKKKTTRPTRILSPRQVSNVIKSGHDTLSITAVGDSLSHDIDSGGGNLEVGFFGEKQERYREVDEKVTLKKMARVAVEDVRELLLAERC